MPLVPIALLLILQFFSPGIAAAAETNRVNFRFVVDQIGQQGEAAIAAYTPETGLDTADIFSDLYFDQFEASGMEIAIGMRNPNLKSELESLFSTVIGLASKGHPTAQVQQAWLDLHNRLQETARSQTPSGASGFWSLALQSFLILLREGFEAILVITALITYLHRQNAEEQLPVVYYGVGLALVASVLTAWLLNTVFQISGADQEALEGITMLIAAGVLFYVSYWLISKSESARWQAWIEGQINKAITRGSLFALGFAAFLAVYREGAETVLFYQALAGQAEGQGVALAVGFIGATIALFVIYWLMRTASLQLPIGLFFAVTAGLLYYLAVTFAGNGIAELQEAGWVDITPVNWLPRISWIGLHPTLETFTAQIVFLVPLPFGLAWWFKQRRQVIIANSKTADTERAGL